MQRSSARRFGLFYNACRYLKTGSHFWATSFCLERIPKSVKRFSEKMRVKTNI
ncbi:hypothetical protein CEV33_1438 [Brucella grignonensis]|uniref:Uncharacterized protein n=1 Tax=Brucella grignonensis TaxID=94627 RepID=A0A256FAI4_9HYPH|nr:hypothetical protein CEV33_1438 [Brucella grignonensis]